MSADPSSRRARPLRWIPPAAAVVLTTSCSVVAGSSESSVGVVEGVPLLVVTDLWSKHTVAKVGDIPNGTTVTDVVLVDRFTGDVFPDGVKLGKEVLDLAVRATINGKVVESPGTVTISASAEGAAALDEALPGAADLPSSQRTWSVPISSLTLAASATSVSAHPVASGIPSRPQVLEAVAAI